MKTITITPGKLKFAAVVLFCIFTMGLSAIPPQPQPTTLPLYLVNNTSSLIWYSRSWLHVTQSGAGQSGTISLSYSRTALATLDFSGNSLRIYSKKGPKASIFQVWIDGVLEATIDMYSPTKKFQVLAYQTDSLSSGSHYLEIRNTNTRNPSSAGWYVHLDYIVCSID